ncbi:unnamed protein product [Oikopleura dioica]|uniref:Uncharacterized protein n=1 Tax=Oikopleura dioica TaxID=34765 RepID=E4WYF7_OIKDI|nr:unnamed protein product [Oikopleura dioica]
MPQIASRNDCRNRDEFLNRVLGPDPVAACDGCRAVWCPIGHPVPKLVIWCPKWAQSGDKNALRADLVGIS